MQPIKNLWAKASSYFEMLLNPFNLKEHEGNYLHLQNIITRHCERSAAIQPDNIAK
ncbi:MAG: hypothetical protein R3Y43_08085 [Alphaproteobacteria bacterium]